MNFNLDCMKMFKFLKGNFKGILKYTLAVSSYMFFLAVLFVINLIIYKKHFLHISYPILMSVLIVILSILGIIYLIGINCEIIHNFIEEKEIFMPKAKGRFKEFLLKGVKIIPAIIVFMLVEILIFLFDTYILTRLPFEVNRYLDILIYVFSLIFFVPFFMAYIYNFELKSFFKKDNFTIFAYAYPEFIYSCVISRFFAFFTNVLFCLMFVFAIIILLGVLYGISLFKNALLTGSFASVMLGILIVFSVFCAFLVNHIVAFYTYSLNAQSFNYGKYFLCKKEAPKRPLYEKILPIVILAILCFINIVVQDFNDNMKKYMHENKGAVSEFVQKIQK